MTVPAAGCASQHGNQHSDRCREADYDALGGKHTKDPHPSFPSALSGDAPIDAPDCNRLQDTTSGPLALSTANVCRSRNLGLLFGDRLTPVFDNARVDNDEHLEAAAAGLERGAILEEVVFGTRDLGEIDALLGRVCTSALGSPIAEVLFCATSVGVVVGLLLRDGRRVVVKAHQPRETFARLEAVHEIQSELFRAGIPCPQPLSGPVTLGNGYATVEMLLDEGEFRDTHDPTCRRLIAQALAWQLQITRSCPAAEALAGGWSLSEGDQLWPAAAHAPTFDFAATSAGAEWIDALGTHAKAAIEDPGPGVVGHSDWSGKHFRFADAKITAIYDWDSLAVRTEAAIVGVAAMTYTTRFDLPGVPRAPTPEEMNAFIDEYSDTRERPLSRAERGQIAAHGLLLAAYTARCEHCRVDGYDAASDAASFMAALRTHGTAYLSA